MTAGAALLASGFPVFHRGFAPVPSSKSSAPLAGEPIVVRDVPIAPGDMVVADCDGVVVISGGCWAEIAHRARALALEEDAIRAALARGERLAGLIGLEGST